MEITLKLFFLIIFFLSPGYTDDSQTLEARRKALNQEIDNLIQEVKPLLAHIPLESPINLKEPDIPPPNPGKEEDLGPNSPTTGENLSERAITPQNESSSLFTPQAVADAIFKHKYRKNLEKIKSIDLSNQELCVFPSQIFSCPNLEHLILSDNNLRNIPPKISKLTKLKELDLSNNIFTDLADSLLGLPSLEILFLDNNKINSVPFENWENSNLKILSLKSNEIINLSPDIRKCKTLKTLYMNENILLKYFSDKILNEGTIEHLEIFGCENLTMGTLKDLQKAKQNKGDLFIFGLEELLSLKFSTLQKSNSIRKSGTFVPPSSPKRIRK